MAKELSEDTAVQISLKTLGGIGFLIATLVGMWFTLQADIAEAKLLPEPTDPEITRMEFDMKDKNIRLSIENTEKAVDDLKDRLIRMEDKLDKLR
jgi:ribosomal protein S13